MWSKWNRMKGCWAVACLSCRGGYVRVKQKMRWVINCNYFTVKTTSTYFTDRIQRDSRQWNVKSDAPWNWQSQDICPQTAIYTHITWNKELGLCSESAELHSFDTNRKQVSRFYRIWSLTRDRIISLSIICYGGGKSVGTESVLITLSFFVSLQEKR